jgi:hypothetical protein
MERIYLHARPVLGFSLGADDSSPMDLVRCSDGSVHRAGQCPMSTGAKVAIGGGIVAATSLVIWLVSRG